MSTPSTLIRIERLDDPRLEPYRDLKRTNRTRDSNWFIAEGRWVVLRLLASDFQVESILLAESAVAELRPFLSDHFPVFVLPTPRIEELVGFRFHRGVLACGRRVRQTALPDREYFIDRPTATWVCCPHTVLPDNLGSIIRISTAFGVDGILIGEQAADPFSRRVIRVSMGNIFELPIVEPASLSTALGVLKSEHGFRIVAATGDPNDTMLPIARPAPRIMLLLGHEAHGLSPDMLQLADDRVTIPMSGKTDSLNVANAAAILLYQLTCVAQA